MIGFIPSQNPVLMFYSRWYVEIAKQKIDTELEEHEEISNMLPTNNGGTTYQTYELLTSYRHLRRSQSKPMECSSRLTLQKK